MSGRLKNTNVRNKWLHGLYYKPHPGKLNNLSNREAELTPQTSASLGLPPPTQAKLAAIPRPGNKSCWSATSEHTHMVYTNTHLISHRADHLIFRSLLSLPQMSVLLTVVKWIHLINTFLTTCQADDQVYITTWITLFCVRKIFEWQKWSL